MKMLGQDLLTQQEFDEFMKNVYCSDQTKALAMFAELHAKVASLTLKLYAACGAIALIALVALFK